MFQQPADPSAISGDRAGETHHGQLQLISDQNQVKPSGHVQLLRTQGMSRRRFRDGVATVLCFPTRKGIMYIQERTGSCPGGGCLALSVSVCGRDC